MLQQIHPPSDTPRETNRGSVTALRAEFVARPETLQTVREGLEERVLTTWGREQGFLNGMVLVSDQEARLTTLITFWREGIIERTREQKMRWLQKILTPYLDRCLRVQTNSTYFLSGSGQDEPVRELDSAQLGPGIESAVLCSI